MRKIRDGARRLEQPDRRSKWPTSVGADRLLACNWTALKSAKLDAVVHWGDAEDGARILNQMRAHGHEAAVLRLRPLRVRRVREDRRHERRGRHLRLSPGTPTRKDPKLEAFREAFRKRFGEEPETYAAHAYDGMNMLIWAIQAAGLNRAKIRDVLAYRTEPWPGVTGDIPLQRRAWTTSARSSSRATREGAGTTTRARTSRSPRATSRRRQPESVGLACRRAE